MRSNIILAVNERMSQEQDVWDYDLDRLLYDINDILHGKQTKSASDVINHINIRKEHDEQRVNSLRQCSQQLMETLHEITHIEAANNLLNIAQTELQENKEFSPTLVNQALVIAQREAKTFANDPYIDIEMAVMAHVTPTSHILVPITTTISNLAEHQLTKPTELMLDTLQHTISHGRAALRETQMSDALIQTCWQPANVWHNRIYATIQQDASIVQTTLKRMTNIAPKDTLQPVIELTAKTEEDVSYEAMHTWLDATHGLGNTYSMCQTIIDIYANHEGTNE